MPFTCIRCGKCCTETEMLLLEEDIARLESLGHNRSEFSLIRRDGLVQLKNVNGHCYFFDPATRRCKVYEWRPLGCRFYPIIYSITEDKCVPDKDCPMSHTVSPEEIKRACPHLRKLVKQLIAEAHIRKLLFSGDYYEHDKKDYKVCKKTRRGHNRYSGR